MPRILSDFSRSPPLASVLILSCYCCARMSLSEHASPPRQRPLLLPTSCLHLCPQAAEVCLRLPPPGGLTRHWLAGLLTSGSQFVGKLFPVIINPSCVKGSYKRDTKFSLLGLSYQHRRYFRERLWTVPIFKQLCTLCVYTLYLRSCFSPESHPTKAQQHSVKALYLKMWILKFLIWGINNK